MDGASDPGTSGPLLTLQEAADRLNVHYMTAYRWVRSGTLPAFKAGGRLRVRAQDLDQFVSQRAVDVAIGPRQGRTDWPLHVERLHDLLRRGEAVEAAGAVRKVVTDGAPAGRVYTRLIAPAMHRIGDDWAEGRITVAEEHRATEIAVAVMARLGDFFRRRGPSRGTAVTLTPEGEHHGLGAMMVADFLRASGYDVDHLGSNVPTDDFQAFLRDAPPDVVCVSVTNRPPNHERLAALAEVAGKAGAAVVVGGQAAEPSAVLDVGAAHVSDLEDLPAGIQALAGALPDG